MLSFFKSKFENIGKGKEIILSIDKDENFILWEYTFKITSDLVEYISKINIKFIELNSLKREDLDLNGDKESEFVKQNYERNLQTLKNTLNPEDDKSNNLFLNNNIYLFLF